MMIAVGEEEKAAGQLLSLARTHRHRRRHTAVAQTLPGGEELGQRGGKGVARGRRRDLVRCLARVGVEAVCGRQ